jgi:hypothetical protein
MKALISFVASAEITKLTEIVKEELKRKGYSVEVSEITEQKKQRKGKQIKLKSGVTDWKPFDLIVLAFPVLGFSSSRLMNSYLRQCINVSGKEVAIIIGCIGLHGNALKKASSIVSFYGGNIKDSLIVSAFLGLNEKKTEKVREFIKRL